MSEIDWKAVVRYVTAGSVAKWIAVASFGALSVIVLSWLAAFLWGAS